MKIGGIVSKQPELFETQVFPSDFEHNKLPVEGDTVWHRSCYTGLDMENYFVFQEQEIILESDPPISKFLAH